MPKYSRRQYHAIKLQYEKEKHSKEMLLDNWRKFGLLDNLDDVYKIYKETKHCQICDIKLTNGKMCKTKKVMNHCHKTNYFLNILCFNCNLHEHNDSYWAH